MGNEVMPLKFFYSYFPSLFLFILTTRNMSIFRRMVASLSVVAILSTLVVSTAFAAEGETFGDVHANDYFFSAVEGLAALGYVDTTKENFNPAALTNRAEAAQFLVNAAGLTAEVGASSPFTDVKTSDWFFEAVYVAYKNNVVSGYSHMPGYYGPGDQVTREQFAKMAVEAFGIPLVEAPATPTFSDVTADMWSFLYVETAAKHGIVKGMGETGMFAPMQNINRADTAVITHRALTTEVAPGDDDEEPGDDDEEPVADGDLNVEFADNNPEDGTAVLIDSDGTTVAEYQALVASYDFTADSADVEVNSVTFTKTGFVADADFDELYLFVDGEEVARGASNSTSKKFVFSSTSGLFTVEEGETANVELRVDLDPATVGTSQMFGFDILSEEDVVLAEEGSDVSGDFPLTGSTLVTVDTEMGTAQVDWFNGFTVSNPEIGSTNKELTKFTLMPAGNDIRFETLRFAVVGTISSSDLGNFKLVDKNDKVLAEVASLDAAKTVTFENLNLVLDTNETYRIKGSILDGADRTFQFTHDSDYPSFVYDDELDARVALTTSGAALAATTIQAGDFTVELASDSPIGGVADEATSTVLARYNFIAKGEKTKVQSFTVKNIGDGNDDATVDALNLKNVKVLVNGSQKGSTVTTLAENTSQAFTFGSSFIINVGETAVVEIVSDLNDASVAADEGIQISEGAASVTYDLLDSNTDDQTLTLPTAYELLVTAGSLDTVLSASTPESQVVVMGTSPEVARWNVSAEDDDVELRDAKFTFTTSSTDTETHVSGATLKLYKDGAVVNSVSRTIQGDNDTLWFGNDEDKAAGTGTYSAVSILDWDLEEDDSYELALELTLKPNALGSSAPVSGVTIQAALTSVTFFAQTETADSAVGISANTHELRAAKVLFAEKKNSYSNQTAGQNKEVMQFSVTETSGQEKATLGYIVFSGSTPTGAITGEGDFTVRNGSTSGNVVAKLHNETAAAGLALVPASYVAATGVLTFGAAHGLEAGDVILADVADAADAIVPATPIVVKAVSGLTATVGLLSTGVAPAAIDITPAVAEAVFAAGDVVFGEQSAFAVPFQTEALGQISKGGTMNYVVQTDTTGLSGASDAFSLTIDDETDVAWWDGEKADGAYGLADLFTSSYIKLFPVTSLWERD